MTVETTANSETTRTTCRRCLTYNDDCYECVERRMLEDSNCEQCELNTLTLVEVTEEFVFRECSACEICRKEELDCMYCGNNLCDGWSCKECDDCGKAKEGCLCPFGAYEETSCALCQTGGCVGPCETVQRLPEEIQRDVSRMRSVEEILCVVYGEEPYCAACQNGACGGDECEAATYLFDLERDIKSLKRLLGARAEPLCDGDASRWEHLTTQQERIAKLEELDEELGRVRWALWDLNTNIPVSRQVSLERDIESLCRVCGISAEPLL